MAVAPTTIGHDRSTLEGLSVRNVPRNLEIVPDRDSPPGEKWVVVTIIVVQKPYTVRVKVSELKAALAALL